MAPSERTAIVDRVLTTQLRVCMGRVGVVQLQRARRGRETAGECGERRSLASRVDVRVGVRELDDLVSKRQICGFARSADQLEHGGDAPEPTSRSSGRRTEAVTHVLPVCAGQDVVSMTSDHRKSASTHVTSSVKVDSPAILPMTSTNVSRMFVSCPPVARQPVLRKSARAASCRAP